MLQATNPDHHPLGLLNCARRQRHRPGPRVVVDPRVEFHLDTVGTSLDIDCVFVN